MRILLDEQLSPRRVGEVLHAADTTCAALRRSPRSPD